MIGRNVEGISMSPVIAKDSEPQNEVIVPIEAWHGMAWHGMACCILKLRTKT